MTVGYIVIKLHLCILSWIKYAKQQMLNCHVHLRNRCELAASGDPFKDNITGKSELGCLDRRKWMARFCRQPSLGLSQRGSIICSQWIAHAHSGLRPCFVFAADLLCHSIWLPSHVVGFLTNLISPAWNMRQYCKNTHPLAALVSAVSKFPWACNKNDTIGIGSGL